MSSSQPSPRLLAPRALVQRVAKHGKGTHDRARVTQNLFDLRGQQGEVCAPRGCARR